MAVHVNPRINTWKLTQNLRSWYSTKGVNDDFFTKSLHPEILGSAVFICISDIAAGDPPVRNNKSKNLQITEKK